MKLLLSACFIPALIAAQQIETTSVTKYKVANDPGGQAQSHRVTLTDIKDIERALKTVPVVMLPQADKHPTWTWSQWFRNQSN